MREGKAIIQYTWLYGFVKGPDGNPEIVPEQAEVVRRMYQSILAGQSLRMIQDWLEAENIPYYPGRHWRVGTIRSILSNEKYCGDVLMQKVFISDCITKKEVKNNGQLPMYLIRNNHKGIVSRDTFNAVQAELARRNAGRSPSAKSAPTGKTSYASKYALSERLVCGECGTLYRRCVWTQKGQKRAVWRCVSRLDYGKKYCHESPTMDEASLQAAIMAAVNSAMSPKEKIVDMIKDTFQEELVSLPDSTMTLGEIKRRLRELDDEFDLLLSDENADDFDEKRFAEIKGEMTSLRQQQEKLSNQLRNNVQVFNRLNGVTNALNYASPHMDQWDEAMIRQLVHTVKVMTKDSIIVYLSDGTEINQEVHTQ